MSNKKNMRKWEVMVDEAVSVFIIADICDQSGDAVLFYADNEVVAVFNLCNIVGVFKSGD